MAILLFGSVSCSNSTEPIEPLVETTTLSNSTVHATDSVIVDVTIENVSRQAQTIDGSVCPAAYLLTTMDDEIVGPWGRRVHARISRRRPPAGSASHILANVDAGAQP